MNRFIGLTVRLFIRWIPDSFVVAVSLSILTFLLAISLTDHTPGLALQSWGDNFWNLLSFTNQIALTFLFGYIFANTPPVRKVLLFVSRLANSPVRAYLLAGTITSVFSLFSWGLGLVTSAIMARILGESCKARKIRIHYPLLVASSFSGFVIWHQGMSSSIGLALATPGHFLEEKFGLVPVTETLFTTWNAGLVLAVILTLPFIMASLRPRERSEIEEIPDQQSAVHANNNTSEEVLTPARRLENSRILSLIVVGSGGAFLYIHFFGREGNLDLNTLNFLFLLFGILLAGSLIRFVRIAAESGRIAVPFLLQYPFYAGIAGLMAESGLAQMTVELFISVANSHSLPFFGFLSGGLLNFFIPSGGGQWAVQGPIILSSAVEIGADIPRTAMAVALGDQWTNLIHPLALIPIVAITGVEGRKIMGYTFVAILWSGLLFSIALLLF